LCKHIFTFDLFFLTESRDSGDLLSMGQFNLQSNFNSQMIFNSSDNSNFSDSNLPGTTYEQSRTTTPRVVMVQPRGGKEGEAKLDNPSSSEGELQFLELPIQQPSNDGNEQQQKVILTLPTADDSNELTSINYTDNIEYSKSDDDDDDVSTLSGGEL